MAGPSVEHGELAAAGPAGGQALQQRAPSRTAPVPGWWACGRMLAPMRAWLAW